MINWLELENRNAIVTGGASGIGKAVCRSLKEAGANVIIVDVNVKTGDTLEDMYCVKCDITNIDNVNSMVSDVIEKFGKVDILVNNAGINFPRKLVDEKMKHPEYEINEKDFDLIFDINVKGAFFCAQACARNMIENKSGVIINMSSESGKEGSEGQSIYTATKGAIDSATRSWAKELGKHGVRVLAVAPGIMEATGLRSEAYKKALAYTRGADKYEELNSDYSKSIPLGREGKLSEVGDYVAFLASNKASYISGTTVNISGGKSRG